MPDTDEKRLALFPLRTVLFPGCTLPLQIFEQRYLRLVKECMRDDAGFVVVLISEGEEVGKAPDVFTVGTLVRITDWETLENGLLGVTITASDRVRVDHPSAQDDGLLTAAVHELAVHEHDAGLLDEYTDLADTLRQLQEHPYAQQLPLDIDYGNAVDINNKLSYLLPIDNQGKQALLEQDSAREHSELLRAVITALQNLENS